MKRKYNQKTIYFIALGLIVILTAIILSNGKIGEEIGSLLFASGGVDSVTETVEVTETALPDQATPTEETAPGNEAEPSATSAEEPLPTETLTPEPTFTETPLPTNTPDIPNLQLSISAADTCDTGNVHVSLQNSSGTAAAAGIAVSFQVVEGEQFISSMSASSWEAGEIGAGGSAATDFAVETNSAWDAAEAGSVIRIRAVISAESQSPDSNVGKSELAAISNPGGCQSPEDPNVKRNEVNLAIQISEGYVSCQSAYFNVSVENTGQGLEATDVVVAINSVVGGEFIKQILPVTWNAYNIPPQGKVLNAVIVLLNDNWLNASSNAKISIEAEITQENTKPDVNVGKSTTGQVIHPGNCLPNPTPTQEQSPTATETPAPTITPTPTQGSPEPAEPTQTALPPMLSPIKQPGPSSEEATVEWVVFHSFRDDNLEIYRLDGIEGSPDAKLYNLSKSPGMDSRPSRSPNNEWVVFQSDRDGKIELYYTDSLGQKQTRLTKTKSNNINPMFAPDNTQIVYQSDRNGSWDIYIVNRLTGKEKQLTNHPADEINPYWSPDGNWLVYQSNRNKNWDVLILNVQSGEEYQLTHRANNEILPAWSSKGDQIAFLAEETGIWNLYVVKPDGSQLTLITAGDGDTGNHSWSPDGTRLTYQAERNGNLDIYTYDLRTRKEFRLTTFSGADSSPSWDMKGENISFTSTRDGAPNIFHVFWQGGTQANLTIHPATDKWPEWSPAREPGSRAR